MMVRRCDLLRGFARASNSFAGVEKAHLKSEALHSVAYDVDKRVLEIEFISGAIYRYFGVPDRL